MKDIKRGSTITNINGYIGLITEVNKDKNYFIVKWLFYPPQLKKCVLDIYLRNGCFFPYSRFK